VSEKKIFDAKVELAKAGLQDELDLDEETSKKLYAELLTLATQSVDRARKSAELVQGAAVAIAGLYTTILGLIFVAKDNPMPWRGIVPTVFFAAAVVLAMGYVAYITRTPGVVQPIAPVTDNAQHRLIRRAYFYTQITRALVGQRAHLLRAAVVSLAIGVLFLPGIFLEFGEGTSSSLSKGAPMSSGSPAATSSPTTVAWPTPAFDEPRALAAIVYQAQIDLHKAALGAETATPDDDFFETAVIVVGALVGGALVVQAARNGQPFHES